MKSPESTEKSLKAEGKLRMSNEIAEAAPTLLFPTTTASREMSKLVRQVVNSIAHFTDYEIVASVLLDDAATAPPTKVICSSKVPPEISAFLTELIFSAEQLKNIFESGIGIKIDELGFASYFPRSHHEFMFDFATVFNLLEYKEKEPLNEEGWHKGDGLIAPILGRQGQLYGLILLGCPKSGLSPNATSILPILAFTNQVAQVIEHNRNDNLLSDINAELCSEKEKLETLFNISCRVKEADTIEAKLYTIVRGIIDIGWRQVSLYLYDSQLQLAQVVQNESARKIGYVLTEQITPERLGELLRILAERWNYEGCYFLRYNDLSARPLIEELFGESGQMSFLQADEETGFWHPYDLLLVPLYARNGRLIGLTQVAHPADGRRPTIESLNLLRLCARESALVIEQAAADAEKEELYKQTRSQAEREAQQRIDLQNANEKLQEMERIRSDFTATLVHDIRSPMTVVLGALELVQLSYKNPNTKIPNIATLVDNAQNTCKQIVKLINELLDLSKFEHSGLHLNKVLLHPLEIIDSVVQDCELLATNKKINLNFGCSPDIMSIMADRAYLQRALVNLLSNAIKYTPEGGQVWFEVRRTEVKLISEGTAYATFTVIDSGPGIPAEDLPYVFDAYYQASNSQGQLSTGLGLAIVKRIAAAHGGNVSVNSQPDIGSAFSIMIPMDENIEETTEV
jgi:signal transduction histidine kinase